VKRWKGLESRDPLAALVEDADDPLAFLDDAGGAGDDRDAGAGGGGTASGDQAATDGQAAAAEAAQATDALRAERETALARVRDLEQQLAERERELSAQRDAAGQAANREVEAYRRALIAEQSREGIVPELVQGATRAELDASVATAKAAFSAARTAALQQLASQGVPVGNPAREAAQAAAIGDLTPGGKIAYGLQHGSGS
jgi:hypothetical protein